jgi:hypothetical protein
MKSGIEYMTFLADWYPKILLTELDFPIGGGIAGDFQFVWFQCTKIWKCQKQLSFSAKFQIQLPVTVRILSCSE